MSFDITAEKMVLSHDVYELPSDLYQALPKTVGRPLFDGKNPNEVVAKLQYAFHIGCDTKTACALAEISTDSYHRYVKNNPEFRDKIESIKMAPLLIAHKNIYNAIVNGNLKASMWWLVHKYPEEYSSEWVLRNKFDELKQQVHAMSHIITEKQRRKLPVQYQYPLY